MIVYALYFRKNRYCIGVPFKEFGHFSTLFSSYLKLQCARLYMGERYIKPAGTMHTVDIVLKYPVQKSHPNTK